MNKYERLEEFKRKVMARIAYDGELPQEVERIVLEVFNGLESRYEDLQCSSTSIKEYIEGNMQYAKSEVNKYIDENRKTSQFQYVQAFMRSLEQDLDNNVTSNVSKHEQEIEQMDLEDGRVTGTIGNILEDYLRDVQSRQNRILDARGYSMDRIDDIQQDTRGFINRIISKNEDKIYEILRQDSSKLKTWLSEQYQDYVMQEKMDEKKSQQEEWKKSLDGGISLEEQSKAAKERNEKKEEQGEQSELSDFIEHMFD